MHDPSRTNQELIEENALLRQRILELEKFEPERKLAEAALRENEQRFRALVEQAAVGVAEIVMETGQFITVNRRLCEMVGRTENDLLATTFQAITHPEDLHLHLDKTALLLAGRIGSYELQKRYIRSDGEIVWVNITVSPLWKQGEKPGRNMIVVEDINDRKRAEEALQESELRYRVLVENASDIIFRTDGTGHFVFINPVALRITGYEEKEIIGRHYPTVIRQDMREEAMKFFGRQFVKGIPNTYSEYPIIVKDGREIWLAQNTQLIFQDGKVIAFQAVARDITERKQAEAYREMSREVLQILNEQEDMKDSIRRVLTTLKTRIGFDAVGIRLQDGDDFPYFIHEGFPTDFLLTENTLIERFADGGVCRDKDGNVSLECTCGLVISGKADPANPLFTPGGSCWTNDSFQLLDIPPGEDPRLNPRNHCIHQGYSSVALVPIRNKEKIVGLLQLNDRRKGCFTVETIELLEGIASHVGGALMRKQAEEALRDSEKRYRELSIVDDLTQLYNSRHFYFQLKIELDRSNRYEQPLTLLLLDLDNFKIFNDAYGHVEGDQVLMRLGLVVKRCLRQTDFAYRYGGEEFTIILPMTKIADGAVIAERIRTEFKKERFSPTPGQDIQMTVSIGLAQYKNQEEMKTFVHRVDQLMYQGKKNGKDRVCHG